MSLFLPSKSREWLENVFIMSSVSYVVNNKMLCLIIQRPNYHSITVMNYRFSYSDSIKELSVEAIYEVFTIRYLSLCKL